MKTFEVIGHRGARCYAPENTLPGYKEAVAQKVDVVDIDVVATKDSVLIGYHDLFINPDIICDLEGKYLANSKEEFLNELNLTSSNRIESFLVKNITFAELKKSYRIKLNPKSNYAKLFPKQKQFYNTCISSLQEIVDYVDILTENTMQFQLEIKNDLEHPDHTYSPEILAKLVYDAIIKNNLLSRIKVQAFDWRILHELNKLDSKIKTAYLESYGLKDNWYRWFANSAIMKAAESVNMLDESGKLVNKLAMPNLQLRSPITIKEAIDNGDELSFIYLIKVLGGYSYEPEDNELKYESLEVAHHLGLKVFVWGWPEHSGHVFNQELIKKLINWQIDGFTTDDPLQLHHILNKQLI